VFRPEDVKDFVKYGFDKVKATVSTKGTVTFKNRTYHVAVGAENFSRHRSTKVLVSDLSDKLYIFEHKQDGILLGEALCRKPFAKPALRLPELEANEIELMIDWLESKNMTVDRVSLIEICHCGVTLEIAKSIYERNQGRYAAYSIKLRQPPQIAGKALFNAFVLDCRRHLLRENAGYFPAQDEF
jgi:hypothetical protein